MANVVVANCLTILAGQNLLVLISLDRRPPVTAGMPLSHDGPGRHESNFVLSSIRAASVDLPWELLLVGALAGHLGRGSSWGVAMGFLTRLLVPRSVRRAVHPGRAVKRPSPRKW